MTSDESQNLPPEGRPPTPPTSETEQELPWIDVTAELDPAHAGRGAPPSLARTWGLVLEARGIPHRRETGARGCRVLVPPRARERAVREIRTYRRENQGWPPLPVEFPQSDNRWPTLIVLALLALFFNITRMDLSAMGIGPIPWTIIGNAHAEKILGGEWWRAITALTLHGDGVHLTGNLLIGGVFVLRLCREVGSGTGWFLVLFSGAAGNVLNAFVQAPDHRAIGASTALFGAVGVLASLGFLKNRGTLRKRQLLPLAGGAALLGLLGSGGDNTDLGAHLFGFLAGLVLGVVAGRWIKSRGKPGARVDLLLGFVSAFAVIAAWAAALWSGSVF